MAPLCRTAAALLALLIGFPLAPNAPAASSKPVVGTVVTWGGGQSGAPADLSGLTDISSAVDHSLALKSDGTVLAWGNNFNYQCNIPPGLSGVTQVAAGDFFSVSLKADGTVAAWGADDYGQCDPPPGETFTAISAGHAHCLGLKRDGTVVAWGSDAYGQSDVPHGLSGVKAIAAVWNYSLALKHDGSVIAWGVNDAGQTDVPSGLRNVVEIAGNENYAMALLKGGSIISWGSGPSVPGGVFGATSIAAGQTHALAVRSDGTVIAWGSDDNGESEVPSGANRVAKVAAGWHYSLALANAITPAAHATVSRTTYNGLFLPPDGPGPDNSGSFTITTTSQGSFTGKLQFANARYPFKGSFDNNGAAQVSIPRHADSPLTLALRLVSTRGGQVSGTVSNASWSADLNGEPAVFDGRHAIAPQAGAYTLVLPGGPTSTNSPGGDSFGTVQVDQAGRVRFLGTLADGTKVTQTVAVSSNGQWPLFIPLYNGKGLLLSSITFADSPDTDLSGDVTWIKPQGPRSKYYPAGFTVTTNVIGSRYHKPARGGPILNLTNADVIFAASDLAQSITNQVTISPKDRVTNVRGGKLNLTFSPGNGQFRGNVVMPGSSKAVSFNGVVLQDANVGRGFFLETGQSGQVLLMAPAP